MEELGEIAEALNGVLTGRDNATERGGSVPDEAADGAVCLMALPGRFFEDADLIDRAEAKPATLSDPSSTHRSSLPPRSA